MLKRFLASAVTLLLTAAIVSAQYAFTSDTGPGALVFEDFDGTTAATNGPFKGQGFMPNPNPNLTDPSNFDIGVLDSDYWISGGLGTFDFGCLCLMDPDMQYGDSRSDSLLSAAYIGGVSTGGKDGIGVYAFDTDNNSGTTDVSLGIEPNIDLFTPGWFETRIRNNTGKTITDLSVAYDIYVYNDTNQTSSYNLSWGTSSNGLTGGPRTSVSSLDYSSSGNQGAGWQKVNRSTQLIGISIANGQYLHLRWSSDAVGGSIDDNTTFDEFGLDNVSVQIISESVFAINVTSIKNGAGGNTINWTTSPDAVSVDIHRSTDLANWSMISTNVTDSLFVDDSPPSSKIFYAVFPTGVPYP